MKEVMIDQVCPWCRRTMDRVAITDKKDVAPPRDGDITICFNCTEWCVFDNSQTGNLRRPTWEEYENIASSHHARLVRQTLLKVKKDAKLEVVPPSITCRRCKTTSYHPKDIEEGYCDVCKDWTRGYSSVRKVPDEQADPIRGSGETD